MPAPGGREACVLGDVIGNDRRRDLIHLQPTVSFRNLHRAQSEFPRLLQQLPRHGEILALHLLDVGNNLIDREFFCGLRNQLMLFRKIFRSKHFVRRALFQQKAPAGDFASGHCGSNH